LLTINNVTYSCTHESKFFSTVYLIYASRYLKCIISETESENNKFKKDPELSSVKVNALSELFEWVD
jgi:hypothetical protein